MPNLLSILRVMKPIRSFSLFLLATILLLTISFIFNFGNSPRNSSPEKDAMAKFKPWESASFKWSYPDSDWDIRDADVALKNVRSHFEAIEAADFSRDIGGDWRMEGPQNIGGRLNVMKQDPFDANHILAGSSAGGLFGTSDGGLNSKFGGTDKGLLS